MSVPVPPCAPAVSGSSARSPVFSVVLGVMEPSALAGTIAQLQRQTWMDWEAIALQELGEISTDGRVRSLGLVRSMAAAESGVDTTTTDLNRAIAAARGAWIVMLGPGDRLATVEALTRVRQSLEGDRDCGVWLAPWEPAAGWPIWPDRPWSTAWLARSWLLRVGGLEDHRRASALAEVLERLTADGCRVGALRRSPILTDGAQTRAALGHPDTLAEFEALWGRSRRMATPFPPTAHDLLYQRLAWGQYRGGHAIAALHTLQRSRGTNPARSGDLATWVEAFRRFALQEHLPADFATAINPFPWSGAAAIAPARPAIACPTPAAPPDHRPLGFVLYRILGNDLPPRHKRGQTLENLRFILRHEPPLIGCEKRWVINRMVDRAIEAALIAELERHRQPYLHLPFDEAAYRALPFALDGFPEPNFFRSAAFERLGAMGQALAIDTAYRLKNQYVMHNNGGRNAALADGRSRGRWILPWDGNCFLTAAAWRAIRTAIAQADQTDQNGEGGCQYAIVPMARLAHNDQLLDSHFIPAPSEEPQIAFRYDARETFDPDRRYGRMPKVELLKRLQVPGPWDSWTWYSWEKPAPPPSPEADRVVAGGWVVRLASGNPHSEADADRRREDRSQGIVGLLDGLDDRLARQRFQPGMPLLPDVWEGRSRDRAIASIPIPPQPQPWPAFPPGNGIAWVRFHDQVFCAPSQTGQGFQPPGRTQLHGDLTALLEDDASQTAAADLGAAGSAWMVQVAVLALYLGDLKTARWTLATGSLTRPLPAVAAFLAPGTVDSPNGPSDAAAAIADDSFWDVVDRLVAVRLGRRIGLDLWTARGWADRAIAATIDDWIKALRPHPQAASRDRAALLTLLAHPLRGT